MICVNDVEYELKFSNENGRDKLFFIKEGLEKMIYDNQKIFRYIISKDKKFVYVESHTYYDGHIILFDLFKLDIIDDEFMEVAYGMVYGYNVNDTNLDYLQLLNINEYGITFENKFYTFSDIYDNEITFNLGCITKNCNQVESQHHKFCQQIYTSDSNS